MSKRIRIAMPTILSLSSVMVVGVAIEFVEGEAKGAITYSAVDWHSSLGSPS